MARQSVAKAASIQKASKSRGGFKIRDYKRGQMVWRFWPPAAHDKLDPEPWKGPYKVLDVDNEHYDVRLRLPARGGGEVEKWVHVSNIKPVQYTQDGKLLITMYPDASC